MVLLGDAMYQDIVNHAQDIWQPIENLRHLFLKNLGAEVIPKGSLFNRNLPYGVINVVNGEHSCESLICQKPALASSLVNTVEFPN